MRWLEIITKHQDEKQLENNVIMMGLNIDDADDTEIVDSEDGAIKSNFGKLNQASEETTTSSFEKYINST